MQINLVHPPRSTYRQNQIRSFNSAWLFLPVLSMIISIACSVPNLLPTQAPTETPPTLTPNPAPQPTPLMVSEATFIVEAPGGASEDVLVYLNILDEVSGLALNARSYEMDIEDESHYSLTLPFSFGTIVLYRYSRQGEAAQVEEHISDGRQLRYRLLRIEGPMLVNDVVTRWTDTKYEGKSGRISGHAIDALTGQPIPNLLVIAGGAPALTTSDGSFLIEGLPPGVHNLVGYAMDGAYHTFQQGARVAEESTTLAELRLNPAPIVQVTFELDVPKETIPAVPIRLAGSLYQLGNTFADLAGGLSTVASRMPVMTLHADGKYRVTLDLPAGSDVRYLYTQGDGFWNTELFEDGKRRLRQLIVPEQNAQIVDSVEAWNAGDSAPITFDITTPPGTPPDDYLSIQFNPVFGWTEPIPMWRLGDNRWAYILNNPLPTISSMHYRFCRSDQCSAADANETPGPSATGFPLGTSLFDQTISEDIPAWHWLASTPVEMTTAPSDVQARDVGFSAGIELQPGYHPTWQPRFANTLDSIDNLGANTIVIAPTWTFTRINPPIMEIVTGQDALWLELQPMVELSKERGLAVAIYPTPHFPIQPNEWWQTAQRDFSWWVVWFERYRAFALHHADLAARSGAQALILGGDWLAPALPNGVLPDGQASGLPADADERWRLLISEVRQHYSGTLSWALPFTQISINPPTFLDSVDTIYILFDAPLSSQPNPTRVDMVTEAGRLLDSGLLPFMQGLNKPIILGVAYPSAEGAATACIVGTDGGCLPFATLNRPEPIVNTVQIDLGEQEEIYAAMLDAVNTRPWINGLVSRGYYPPTSLQDYSSSVRGKPAETVLRYWFPRLLTP